MIGDSESPRPSILWLRCNAGPYHGRFCETCRDGRHERRRTEYIAGAITAGDVMSDGEDKYAAGVNTDGDAEDAN